VTGPQNKILIKNQLTLLSGPNFRIWSTLCWTRKIQGHRYRH
jgi:hypothetical protein